LGGESEEARKPENRAMKRGGEKRGEHELTGGEVAATNGWSVIAERSEYQKKTREEG